MERKYHHFDAQGKILGRLATEIARVLIGKHRVDFENHLDAGDFVVVTNSDGVRVSGNKAEGKIYHRFSGYPGGITSISFKDQMKKDSKKVIWSAVYGMLPKNNLRPKMLRRLKIYEGAAHTHKIDVTH